MKLLHVISGLPPSAGGPTVVAPALAAAQVRAGHSVTLCSTDVDLPAGRLSVPLGVPVDRDGAWFWYFPVQFRPLYLSLGLGRWLWSRIGQFDLVHIHGLYRFPPSFTALLARRRGVPYLIRPHGALDPFLYRRSSVSAPLKRAYERLWDFPSLRRAAAIHYTSEQEARRGAELGLRAPAVVVPNGVDWTRCATLPERGAWRRPLGLEPDAPVVLFLGRLTAKKGLDLLVPSFARAATLLPRARLVIAGPDNEGLGARVRAWCRQQGVADRTLFTGLLTPAQVRGALAGADVFVLPSRNENFGMAVVEAMACGCPVVISDQVEIHPAVSDAAAGLVVSLSVHALADAMLRVLREPGLGRAMGQRGRELVRQRYDWDRVAGQLDAVYAGILARRSPKAGTGADAPAPRGVDDEGG